MQFLNASVEQPCCIVWMNDCEIGLEGLWKCSYKCKSMQILQWLWMISTSTAYRQNTDSISKIQVRLQEWKTPMNIVLIFRDCIGDGVLQKVQVLHISQNASFCLCMTKFRARLERGGVEEGRHKPFGQKWWLINSEVQNSRKVCPG